MISWRRKILHGGGVAYILFYYINVGVKQLEKRNSLFKAQANNLTSLDSYIILHQQLFTCVVAESINIIVVNIVTGDHIFDKGLRQCGFTSKQFEKSSREASLQRFRHLCGSNPIVYARIWEDLQNTTIPEARIYDVADIDLVYFWWPFIFWSVISQQLIVQRHFNYASVQLANGVFPAALYIWINLNNGTWMPLLQGRKQSQLYRV